MLIKKITKLYRKYRNRDKYERLRTFVFSGRYFLVIVPRNVISRTAYIVPELDIRLKNCEKSALKKYIMSDDKLRGRYYTILC